MSQNTWAQDLRLLGIETSLGKDKLLLTSLTGQEAIPPAVKRQRSPGCGSSTQTSPHGSEPGCAARS